MTVEPARQEMAVLTASTTVEMENYKMENNVMMEIELMVMDVATNVLNKQVLVLVLLSVLVVVLLLVELLLQLLLVLLPPLLLVLLVLRLSVLLLRVLPRLLLRLARKLHK